MVKIWKEASLVFWAIGDEISMAAHRVRPCINGVNGGKPGMERAEDENCEHKLIELIKYRQNTVVEECVTREA